MHSLKATRPKQLPRRPHLLDVVHRPRWPSVTNQLFAFSAGGVRGTPDQAAPMKPYADAIGSVGSRAVFLCNQLHGFAF
jgi:hypothetical protein